MYVYAYICIYTVTATEHFEIAHHCWQLLCGGEEFAVSDGAPKSGKQWFFYYSSYYFICNHITEHIICPLSICTNSFWPIFKNAPQLPVVFRSTV